jgi:hypothetical protein
VATIPNMGHDGLVGKSYLIFDVTLMLSVHLLKKKKKNDKAV